MDSELQHLSTRIDALLDENPLILLLTAFEESPMSKMIVDMKGNVLKANAAFCSLIGYTEKELKNIGWLGITFQDDLMLEEKERRSFLSGNLKYVELSKRLVKKDGELIWVYVSVQSFKVQGTIVAFWFFMNIPLWSERPAVMAEARGHIYY